jgi:hypothetical protein
MSDIERKKRLARQRVAARIRRGAMPRAIDLPCEGCGVVYEGNGRHGLHVYHHYSGYDGENALKVRPLCPSCHEEAHHGEAGERASPLILRSIRVSQDVWEMVQGHEMSPNQLLRIALGLEMNEETVRKVRQRRETRREQLARERAAADVTAQAVGRDDVDYSDTESTPTTNVASLDAVGVPLGGSRGKASVQTWRRGIREKGDSSR